MTEPLPDGHPDRWLPDGFQDPGPVHIELTPELRQAVLDGLELVGTSEIAQRFGVNRTTVSMWAQRRESSGFPVPLEVLAAGPVYDMAAVRAWYESRYGKGEK